MKISDQTLAVLQNFSSINPSIYIKEGNTISTVSHMKTMFAKAAVDETFEKSFGVYDLNQFLSVMGIVENAQVNLMDTSMVISNNDMSINYRYADKSLIVTPPDKDIALPSVDLEFVLTAEAMRKVMQGFKVLQAPDIVIEVVDNVLYIAAKDVEKKDSSNDLRVKIKDVEAPDCSYSFKVENFKLLPLDYNVEVSNAGITRFVAKEGIEYIVATSV